MPILIRSPARTGERGTWRPLTCTPLVLFWSAMNEHVAFLLHHRVAARDRIVGQHHLVFAAAPEAGFARPEEHHLLFAVDVEMQLEHPPHPIL